MRFHQPWWLDSQFSETGFALRQLQMQQVIHEAAAHPTRRRPSSGSQRTATGPRGRSEPLRGSREADANRSYESLAGKAVRKNVMTPFTDRSLTPVFAVQRFTVVDNSYISPTRLTVFSTRRNLASQELSMLPI